MKSSSLFFAALLLILCLFFYIANSTTHSVDNSNSAKKFLCEQKKIRLPVDHFSFANNDMFELRYLLNDYWYNGNNPPIFFYTGNEANIEVFAQNFGFMWDIAPQFQAVLIFAEHRYYGESMPYGNKSFSEPKYLGYLTSQQALADYIDLIEFIKKDVHLKESPVIVFGSSYGGLLSAWLRMKYPHIVQGAIASTVPTLYVFGTEDCHASARITTADFKSVNPICSSLIRRSWQSISDVASTDEGKKWLYKNWSLCNQLNTTQDIYYLKKYLAHVYVTLAMYDYPYESEKVRLLDRNSIPLFCSHLTNSSLDGKDLLLALYRAVSSYSNQTGKMECLSTPDSGYLQDYLSRTYQLCTESIMLVCYDGVNDMFEPFLWNFTKFSEFCYKKFQVRPQGDRACRVYGCKDIYRSSNIGFSIGHQEEWSGISSLMNFSISAHAVIIHESNHHLDLHASNPNDSNYLIESRKYHVSSIKGWIKQYRDGLNRDFGGLE